MAKKNDNKNEEPVIIGVVVEYDDLMAGKVHVTKDGVTAFYIDPARALGEFVLRPIPQAMEEPGEIPDDWRRPTREEEMKANAKIDWETSTDPESEKEPAE